MKCVPKVVSLTAAIAIAAFAMGCNPRNGDTTSTTTDPNTTGTPATSTAPVNPPSGATDSAPAGPTAEPTAASPASPDQGSALALLSVINEHEIAAANQAIEKKVQGKVLEFATLMRDEHTKNLEQTRTLQGTATATATVAAPDPTSDAAAQKSKGEQELTTLSTLEGEAYAKAYAAAMVKGHDEALAAIDGKMLPAATDDAVRKHLTTTREHVAHHLELARQLPQP